MESVTVSLYEWWHEEYLYGLRDFQPNINGGHALYVHENSIKPKLQQQLCKHSQSIQRDCKFLDIIKKNFLYKTGVFKILELKYNTR